MFTTNAGSRHSPFMAIQSPSPKLAPTENSFNEERERLHRRMLSVVAHDLKTPLASIIGSLEIFDRMKSKLPQERQEALVHIALQESYRLETLITNVLDMAKLENGVIQPHCEPVDLGQTINNAIRPYANRLSNYTIKPKSTDIENPNTDPALLSRVMSLVLDNAVKFGGASPEVEITYGRDQDGRFSISIQDNGAGIPAGQEVNIFSKFSLGREEERQSTATGTGLGLAICKEIMSLLGGEITVANAPNGGAVFMLCFASA